MDGPGTQLSKGSPTSIVHISGTEVANWKIRSQSSEGRSYADAELAFGLYLRLGFAAVVEGDAGGEVGWW